MKKIILSVTMLAIAASTIFVACKKDEATSSALGKNESKTALNNAKYTTGYTPINFSELNLGELHNQHVLASYAAVNFSSPTLNQDLNNYYTNISFDPTLLGLTNTQFDNLLINSNNQLAANGFDLRNSTSTQLNPDLEAFVFEVLDACDNITTLATFNSTLDQIQANADDVLEDQDFDILKGTIIVAKSSAYLWSSTNIGGYGLFDQLQNNNVTVSGKGVKGAIIGDASASAQYFTAIGIAGAAGLGVPGANAVILGGWGIAAALGSACGALGF